MKELKPHQLKAVRELSNGKILKGGTGSGKTLTAMRYYWDRERPKDVYVITTARKRDELDWQKEAASFGITNERTELAGKLTVDSWNNIKRYADVKDAFFIFDEQRLVGSGAWARAFIKLSKANSWILLTATPGDTWMDYIPVFVANGFYKNRTDFIRQHVVYNTRTKFPKVDRYVDVGRLVAQRHSLLVEMRFVRHTVPHTEVITVDYDKEMFNAVWNDRWHVYEERPLKDVGEMCAVARRVVNTHPSRLNTMWELRGQHPRLIIFYNFNYELDILRTLADDVELAEWNGHKHEAVPTTEEWVYLVQYTAGAEAWNCTTTDTLSMYSLPYSYRQFVQSYGRIDRMDTPYIDLWYKLVRSNSPIDKMIWRALTEKRNFNESEVSNMSGSW